MFSPNFYIIFMETHEPLHDKLLHAAIYRQTLMKGRTILRNICNKGWKTILNKLQTKMLLLNIE